MNKKCSRTSRSFNKQFCFVLHRNIGNIAEGMGDKMAVFIQWFMTWFACYVMALTRSYKLTLVVIGASPLLIMTGALLVKVSEQHRHYALDLSSLYSLLGPQKA